VFGENMALNPWDTDHDVELFAHEFGHTYQSRIAGPAYYARYGFPSGIARHQFPEADADYRAFHNLGIWPHTDPNTGQPWEREPSRFIFGDFFYGSIDLFRIY
jgi:hypothetical protein